MSTGPSPSPGCARVRARLEALVDRALPALEEARVRGHLEACAACRALHEEHLELLAAIRAAVPDDLAPDVARVASAVRAELAGRRPARRRPVLPVALSAAAAAVLLLILIETRAPDFRPPQGLERMAALQGVLERLPSWSDVVRGLASLSRGLS